MISGHPKFHDINVGVIESEHPQKIHRAFSGRIKHSAERLKIARHNVFQLDTVLDVRKQKFPVLPTYVVECKRLEFFHEVPFCGTPCIAAKNGLQFQMFA
jgi:hypothetical protein